MKCLHEVKCKISCQEGMGNLAACLSSSCQVGDVFYLQGDLGLGKTTFARSFIQSYVKQKCHVPSPTFSLVQVYDEGGEPFVWHFDLYRLSGPDDCYDLDMEQAFDCGISLIEWPDRLGQMLVPYRCDVVFEMGKSFHERLIVLKAYHERFMPLLEKVIHEY